MGQVSGFWLTWYYFSGFYGTVIALVEIGGGLLLAWPRTSLIGALVLLPVVGNIILTDTLFGVGALPASVAVLICLAVVIRPHARRLAGSMTGIPSIISSSTPVRCAFGRRGRRRAR